MRGLHSYLPNERAGGDRWHVSQLSPVVGHPPMLVPVRHSPPSRSSPAVAMTLCYSTLHIWRHRRWFASNSARLDAPGLRNPVTARRIGCDLRWSHDCKVFTKARPARDMDGPHLDTKKSEGMFSAFSRISGSSTVVWVVTFTLSVLIATVLLSQEEVRFPSLSLEDWASPPLTTA